MSNCILETEKLCIGYSSKKGESIVVAKNINIKLKKNKLIALVGENGIGKSTLLRNIAGIQKHISGNILLNNKPVADYNSLELAQNISVVLSEKLLPSDLKVFELIALGRQPYTNWLGKLSKNDLEIIATAAKLTETTKMLSQKYFKISDGQMQRVLIARAVAQDTDLIIMDEPTTHLDVLQKMKILKLLQNLAKNSNKSILFSTHDIEMAVQMSDEIIIMTSEKTIQNKPQWLIENGCFKTAFRDAFFSFDLK